MLGVACKPAHVVCAAGVLGFDEPDTLGNDFGGAVDDDVPRLGDRDVAGERGENGERGGEGGLQRGEQGTEGRQVVTLIEEEALHRLEGDQHGVEERELDGVVAVVR